MEKRETLHTAAGSVNWGSHCSTLYGGFSET